MAAASFLAVAVVMASCLSIALGQHIRLVSASQYDLNLAAADGYTLTQLATNDQLATTAALQWQNSKTKGSVIASISGTALNENYLNGVATPEWASYVKVIDFKTAAAYQVYAAKTAPSFQWTTYTQNKKYTITKEKWVGTLSVAASLNAFPAAAVYHISLNNASTVPLTQAVTDRVALNKAITSLTVLAQVFPWTPAYTATDADPQQLLNFVGFTSTNAAIAYKAYKNGNPPGPVPILPFYATIKAELTPNKDIEFYPKVIY